MGYYYINSKLQGKDDGALIKPPLVIDGEKLVGPLQVYPADFSDDQDARKQQWEFKADPAGSGYYFIKNRVNDSYITNPSSHSGSGLTANSTFDASHADHYLWQFIQDPGGSGYFFISSMRNGYVIEAANGSGEQGTGLVAGPIKSSGNDNQLWRAPFPSSITLPTELEWLNQGTGTGTTGSDAAECAYTVSLRIKWNGKCHFWGSYINRGDTFASTAPPQDFGVAMVVHDIPLNGYSFSYGGFVWSAPQANSTVTWDYKGSSQVIADNWVLIALKDQASVACNNQAVEGTGLNGASAPPGTADAIFNLLQAAVTASDGGSIGTVYTPSKDDIFSGWAAFPDTAVASGGAVGNDNGYFPAGWVPSGAASSG
jgi:hypothetical protein